MAAGTLAAEEDALIITDECVGVSRPDARNTPGMM